MKTIFKVALAVLAFTVLLAPLTAAEQGSITIPRTEHITVLTLDLHRGDTIDYSWSANNSVTFRIENITGTTFVDRAGQTGSGSWQVAADGTFTFEFRNTIDFPVTVQWNISPRPALAATYVYLLLAFVVGMVGLGTFLVLRKKPAK